MDSKREALLARLQETFRGEAADRLDALERSVVELDRPGGPERAALVEGMFRDAHSLKGAARSVGLPQVEALSAELESVLAALKSGTSVATPALVDEIQRTCKWLRGLCGESPAPAGSDLPGPLPSRAEPPAPSPGPAALTGEAAFARPAGEKLGPTAPIEPGSSPGPGAELPAATAALPLQSIGSPAPLAVPDSPLGAAAGTGTVRIAATKLDRLLRDAEELLGDKLALQAQANELRGAVLAATSWHQRWRRQVQAVGRLLRAGGESAQALELEALALESRNLEGSLRKVASDLTGQSLEFAGRLDGLLESARAAVLEPCGHLLAPLKPALRELARTLGKEADLVIVGDNLELDRRVMDALRDPLNHLLRNAIDHGVETPEERRRLGKNPRATIRITVRPVEGQRVAIEFADDGSGLNAARIRAAAKERLRLPADAVDRMDDNQLSKLLFQSGMTTSAIVTDLSGRGLGLAIVREKLEQLGGRVEATTVAGQGTRFELVVPLTLATLRGVLVAVGERQFVLPVAGVLGVARWRPTEVQSSENRELVPFQGRAVAWARLGDVLGLPTSPATKSSQAAQLQGVVVASATGEVALQVDAVLGEQEVMVKSLGSQLRRVRNVAAAAAVDTGAILPVLSIGDLVESVREVPSVRRLAQTALEDKPATRILVAEDSITARTLLKTILEGAGYVVTTAVDGMDALTQLKKGHFDALVTDVDMPRLNGFELTAQVRSDENMADLPVILCTALASPTDREHGVRVGASAYLVKSDFDQSNLLEVVARFVG